MNPIAKTEVYYSKKYSEFQKQVKTINHDYFSSLNFSDAVNIREATAIRYNSPRINEIMKSFEKIGFIINKDFPYVVHMLAEFLINIKDNKEEDRHMKSIRKVAFLVDTPDDFNIMLYLHYKSWDIYQKFEWPTTYPSLTTYYMKSSTKEFLQSEGFMIILS